MGLGPPKGRKERDGFLGGGWFDAGERGEEEAAAAKGAQGTRRSSGEGEIRTREGFSKIFVPNF